jgi:ABC-type uncharacterized transport system permease subunit
MNEVRKKFTFISTILINLYGKKINHKSRQLNNFGINYIIHYMNIKVRIIIVKKATKGLPNAWNHVWTMD